MNFVLNLITITLWQSTGAAISSIIAELTITIAFMVLSRKLIALKTIAKISVKYFISALVMFAVLLVMNFYLPEVSIAVVGAKIATGALVYFAVLRFVVRDGFLISEAGHALNKILHH